MAESFSFTIAAHPNIYNGMTGGRELRIDFSVPSEGTNNETAIVVFVPGFGGNIDSKVYKKMRELFADKYNFVTLQCDYFGSKYMQGADNFSVQNNHLGSVFTNAELNKIKADSSLFLKLLQQKNVVFPVTANINESKEEFNDMGYMQAIDIITAIEAVKIVLKDNNREFNDRRIIGYGHSHGAYLLHLSNLLVPNIFSYIIDNSAWIEPMYLSSNRFLYQKIGNATLAIEFNYLAKTIVRTKSDLNLKYLYEYYKTDTQIIAFQGNNDNLVNHLEKKRIIESLDNSTFILVTEEDIDNKKFKANTHGLEADFLELFSYALELENLQNNTSYPQNKKYTLQFNRVHIDIDFGHGLPIFDFKFLYERA